MKFSIFQVTRKGGRVTNEDRMGYCATRKSGLFMLADGLGGHPEGEVAAQLALQTMASLYQRDARPVLKSVPNFLTSSLIAAHTQILKYASSRAMRDSPRTTVVAAVVQGTTATWIHSGDSRLYVVRNGKLLTRTRDHSNVERPRPGAGSAAANRNLLQACLGSPTIPIFEMSAPLTLQQGDRIMLCSDGVWGVLDDLQIARALSARQVSDSVPGLAEMALRKGGPRSDNVTLLALEWEGPDAPDEARVSTGSMRDGVLATTILPSVSDNDGDDLDDDAIKRSIAKINEAMRQFAARRN